MPLHIKKEQARDSWEQHQWTHQLASLCTEPLQILCISGLTGIEHECSRDDQDFYIQSRLPRGDDDEGGKGRGAVKVCLKDKHRSKTSFCSQLLESGCR